MGEGASLLRKRCIRRKICSNLLEHSHTLESRGWIGHICQGGHIWTVAGAVPWGQPPPVAPSVDPKPLDPKWTNEFSIPPAPSPIGGSPLSGGGRGLSVTPAVRGDPTVLKPLKPHHPTRIGLIGVQMKGNVLGYTRGVALLFEAQVGKRGCSPRGGYAPRLLPVAR